MVCVAGIGLDNAGRAARRLVEAGAHGLVSWGCAAALSPRMKSGDLCLPLQIVDEQTRHWPAAEAWHQRAQRALLDTGAVCTEPLVSAEGLAVSTADKRKLAAASGAVAVDMESAAVAAVASECDVPFIAVRAIADPADIALPGTIVRATDATGAVRRTTLLGGLLSHPGEIGAVVRLAWQFRAALRTLTRAAARMDAGMLLGANEL
jgi:adenosylhomocysteine nucleosidase